MKTVSYSKEEKIRLLRANGYVVREEKVANFSKQSFAFKTEKKYNIDTVFDSTVKNILLMINPGGGGEEEEEEEQGFYSAGVGIDITGPVISLSHLGFEDLTDPGSDKILFWDSAAGSVGWDDLAATSKVKVSSNDTTPGYLEDKLVISYYEGNVSEILELSTINEGADEIRVLQLDETKINHDNISGVSADDHHSQAHTLATTGPHTDSLPLTDLTPGTAGDIITRQVTDWAVLAKGTENYVLKMGATYPAWGTVDWSELTGTQPAPVAHNHAWSDITSGVPTTFGGYGISDTLANLNTALSDATLYKWEADQGAVNIHGDNVVYGSTVSTACVGNDARLSNARTPTTHAMDSATYHTSTDITILNATTSKHGFLRKLGGGTTNYLRADGTWAAPPGTGGMTYPGAGIALSTGSAWGTSITNNSANWNTAYTHSQVAGGNSVHVSTTENTQWDAAYTHSIDNTQAHSDYLLNTTDTLTGTLTVTTNVTSPIVTVNSIALEDSTDRSGLLEINRKGATGYTGVQAKFSATALWSLMGNETVFGLYDDYNSDWILQYAENAGLNLYHNGGAKLSTTATGVTVTGTVVATNFTGLASSATTAAACTGNALTATKLANINTTFSGSYPMTVNVSGTIYSHTAVTFTGSTGTLTATQFSGGGVTTGSNPGHTHTTTAITDFDPTNYLLDTTDTFTGELTLTGTLGSTDIYIGSSKDARFYYVDSDGLYIKNLEHGELIYIQGEDVGGVVRDIIKADPDGSIILYHAGSSKLATSAAGVTVTGTLAATTITGANVTTGANPGHTHTTTAITDFDPTNYLLDTTDTFTGNLTITGTLAVNGNIASGFAATFFNDGNNVNRYGIKIQCGEDVLYTGSNYPIRFYDGDGGYAASVILYSGHIGFTSVSDIKLKENIEDYNLNGLNIINQMQYRSFNWKRDKNKLRVNGWVADEVEEIYPFMVMMDSETGYKTVDQSTLIPVMMAGIKELDVKFRQHYGITETHKDKIIRLESRVKDLEDEVELLKN